MLCRSQHPRTLDNGDFALPFIYLLTTPWIRGGHLGSFPAVAGRLAMQKAGFPIWNLTTGLWCNTPTDDFIVKKYAHLVL